MSEQRKNFISVNEGFTCEACSTLVPAAKGTCRNHCIQCLASKHVDDKVPGDRASSCKAIMPAVAVEGSNPDELILVHECSKCGKQIRNKVAPDDDRNALFALMSR